MPTPPGDSHGLEMNQIRLFAGLIIAALTVASFTIQTWAESALTRSEELTARRRVVVAGAAFHALLVGEFERAEVLADRAIRESAAPITALTVALWGCGFGRGDLGRSHGHQSGLSLATAWAP
jgi:hypothetical protein